MGRPMGCPVGRPIGRPMGRRKGFPMGHVMGIPRGLRMGIPMGRRVGRPMGLPAAKGLPKATHPIKKTEGGTPPTQVEKLRPHRMDEEMKSRNGHPRRRVQIRTKTIYEFWEANANPLTPPATNA